MSDRPTPETDANTDPHLYNFVRAKFARKLERERDELREELEILRSNKMSDPLLETTFKHLIRERDAAIIKYTGEANELERQRNHAIAKCEDARRERDEAREQANVMHEQWLSKGRCCENLAEELHEVKQQRDEAIARSKEWSDWCVEYKSELEEAQKDTKILSRRMKVLWDSSEKVCRERDELLKECMQMSIEFGLPPTIRPADGEIRRMINGWKQAIVERDEAREALDCLLAVIGLTPIAGNKHALQDAVDYGLAVLRKQQEAAK